jgi:hypothetical protein
LFHLDDDDALSALAVYDIYIGRVAGHVRTSRCFGAAVAPAAQKYPGR